MTRPLAFQTLRATRLVAFIIMALTAPQASHALEPLGNTSCGQLGQPTCTIDMSEWWETGTTTGCDRGLNSELRWPELRTYCINGSRESAPVSAWASKALRLQRELQASLPLNQLTVLGAHNAFNNSNDGYIVPNQQYSITDQLRMGIRSLSIDVHWYNNALRLCHGTMEYGVPHLVCSLQDRPYFQIIEELNQWMRKPENSQEVVFLELEAYTDGHNAELLAPIHAHVSDLVFKPSMMPEGGLPTLQDIRAQGKRLILTGVQDGGADLFIERMDKWPPYGPSFIKNFVSSSCSYNNNGTLTGMDSLYRNTLLRYSVNEDSVVMPFWNGPEEVGVITNEALRQLTACNVTGISLDQVTPDKIQNAIWSWNVNEPNNVDNEDCAEMSSMGRWRDTQCGEIRRFACRHDQDPARWRITVSAGGWQQGASQCASEYPGYQFAVPRNGYENKKLVAAADGVPVWMNLNDIAIEGLWSRSGSQASTVELFSLGKCMTDSSGQASNGATLQLWECTGGLNQKWILAEDGTIRSAINTGKCLDLAGSNTSNGTNIVVYDCHNGGNQRWIVDGPVLRSALKRSKVFDVSGGNSANGTRIQIWDYNGGGGQQWTQVRR